MTVENTFKEVPVELTFVRDYLHLNLGFQDNMNMPISINKNNKNNKNNDVDGRENENEYENKLYNLMNNNDQIEQIGIINNNMNESSLNYSNNMSASENKSYMKINKSIVIEKNNEVNKNNTNNISLSNSIYMNESSIINEPLKNSYFENKLEKLKDNNDSENNKIENSKILDNNTDKSKINNYNNSDNKKLTDENDVDYSVSMALNNKTNISGLNLDDVWDHSILTEESKTEDHLYNSKIN